MPANLTASSHSTNYNFPALIFGILLIIIIICGNVLVCLSVYTEKALKTTTNYFIVSLAVADLLLAVLVLPLFVYAEFQDGVWSLNMTLCDGLMTMDVMLCTASIFNLCAISIDRFIAVSIPLNYNRKHVDQRQIVLLSATWILALAVASPVMFGINNVPNRDHSECKLEDNNYVLYSSVCSFFVPWVDCDWLSMFLSLISRKKKVLKVIPIILFLCAFLFCWTPFFVVHTMRALCEDCYIPSSVTSIVTWLGYVNSALNPVIYTVFNTEFRKFFRKFLPTLPNCC
uniref:D(4) dopamine receptor-like n=1 Tax=Sinocyclocheilus rhinocerous TaxID=307959 RepID=A0A673IRI6_9TELE